MSKLAAAAAVTGVGGTGAAGTYAAYSFGAFGGGTGTGASETANSAQTVAQQPSGAVSVAKTSAPFQHHSSTIQEDAFNLIPLLMEESLIND